MDSLGRILVLFLLTSLLLLECRADGLGFFWGFPTNFVQTTLAECSSMKIRLIPLNSSTTSLGVPPYYMMAYAEGGTTIVSHIGDDPDQLSWQVQNPKGSNLILTVVDSANSTGGFNTNFFTVVDGDTSCQPPAPTNPATVTPNVTTTIHTCEHWGLRVTGGVKPYQMSLVALSGQAVTNVTMGPDDEVFTFIDRANPGERLLAAVVDATGQWGISSMTVPSAGSKDTSCPGLDSLSHTLSQIQADQAAQSAAAAAKAKAKSTALALGIVFGLILPLFLAGGAFWWWRRRKSFLKGVVDGQDARPRPWDANMQERAERPSLNLDTSMVRVDNQNRRSATWVVDANNSPPRQTDSPTSIDMASTDLHASTVPTPFLTSTQVQSSVSMIRSPASQLPSAMSRSMSMARSPLGTPEAAVLTPNSTSPAATLTPAQRYRKVLEAYTEAQAARSRLASGSGSGSGNSTPIAGPSSRPLVQRSQSELRTNSRTFPPIPRRAGSSLRLPSVGAIPEVGPDIIIQHRDGGIVEELPPPYPADSRYPATPGPPPTPAPPPTPPSSSYAPPGGLTPAPRRPRPPQSPPRAGSVGFTSGSSPAP
ncbi:hypothetical protein L227DRAFT_193574 [Lentinus tigrinus ALCF2SS1-6]|uniref:Mid2 domain-containing protein n=1 Tax=Lentinus tigrinus ALCF2SS1-6 TaxID=1328759 RepID=A0A5C2S471_9APHY|nr:hypothetical protein L227DRAFT_193574 [Lentinus tigrinus ALCF2SS1-6]